MENRQRVNMPSLPGAATYPKSSASCNLGLAYHAVGPTMMESSEGTQWSWARSSLCTWDPFVFQVADNNLLVDVLHRPELEKKPSTEGTRYKVYTSVFL